MNNTTTKPLNQNKMKTKLYLNNRGDGNYFLDERTDTSASVIASLNYEDYFEHKLSLKNCQAIERGWDLDELLDNITPKNGTTGNISERIGFVKGFQKALELMGDKKFSEEDMRKMYDISCDKIGLSLAHDQTENNERFLSHLRSIQQTEWEVTFNPDELDADGCLILKRKQ